MALQHCTEADRRIIAECLMATVDGPFFPEWEFETLFGLGRSTVAEVMQAWPRADEADERVDLAVNNALGNLGGYPHGQERDWDRYISVPPSQLLEVLKRWRLPIPTE